jgi:hypothetical protein
LNNAIYTKPKYSKTHVQPRRNSNIFRRRIPASIGREIGERVGDRLGRRGEEERKGMV